MFKVESTAYPRLLSFYVLLAIKGENCYPRIEIKINFVLNSILYKIDRSFHSISFYLQLAILFIIVNCGEKLVPLNKSKNNSSK